MPTVTYQRIWCKTCEEFTIHTIGDEPNCKTCNTVYSDVYLRDIPKEKKLTQRDRYKASKRDKFNRLLSTYLNPIEATFMHEFPNIKIIESDAGQKSIDEERSKNIEEEISKVKAVKEEAKEYKGLLRNDLCRCGSGKKYKKCHLLIFRRFL